jgi:uroporphyrinogen decarboxylase
MSRDRLTPRERLAAYGRGEALDRLPCVPIVGNGAARVIGAKIGELRGNGRLIAEAQIAAWRLFGYDTVRIFTDLYGQAEAMGATVHYPEDETAYLATPAITTPQQISRLRPADPYRDGHLLAHLEAMERTGAAIGHAVPVAGALTGPFTTASFLIGAETLSRLLLRDPVAAHRLCHIALETALAYAEAMLATGAVPSLTEPMASSTVISPRQFREFVFPYLKQLIDFLHARGHQVTLHICGRTGRIWEDMVAAGADTLSLDNEVDLAEAKVQVGDHARLMGNIHPSAVMLQGNPAEVRRAVFACLRQAGDNPRGFIVASGCSLPTETPFANIHAMLDAVREAGWPLQPEQLAEVAA